MLACSEPGEYDRCVCVVCNVTYFNCALLVPANVVLSSVRGVDS